MGLIFLAFLSGSPLWIGVAVAAYVVCYAGYRMKQKNVEEYLETQAMQKMQRRRLRL